MRQNVGISAVGFSDLVTLLGVASIIANQIAEWKEVIYFELHFWSEVAKPHWDSRCIKILLEPHDGPSPYVDENKVRIEHANPNGVSVEEWIECLRLTTSAVLARDWHICSFNDEDTERTRKKALEHYTKKNWRGFSFTRRDS